jgi:hypothetical protein
MSRSGFDARKGSLTAARPRRNFTAFPDACEGQKTKVRGDCQCGEALKIRRKGIFATDKIRCTQMETRYMGVSPMFWD